MLVFDDFALRHLRENDLIPLAEQLNQLAVRGEYLPCALVTPHKLAQQYRENGLTGEVFERLLLVDAQDRMLGTLWHFKSVPYFDSREIGYILFDVPSRGQGLMSRAVGRLTEHLFQSLPLNRLDIRMDSRNRASEKVALNNGFQLEGVARGANFVRGQHVDMKCYGLLRSEWQALHGQ